MPWWGIKPTTLMYQDDILTNWAIWSVPSCFFPKLVVTASFLVLEKCSERVTLHWLRRFSSAQMVFILWWIKAKEKAVLWLNNTILSIITISADFLKSAAYLELLSYELSLDSQAHIILRKNPDHVQQARKSRQQGQGKRKERNPGLRWAYSDFGSLFRTQT